MPTLETQKRFTKLYKEVKNELSKVLPLGEHINSEPKFFQSISVLGKCKIELVANRYKLFTISLNEYLENCKDQTIKNTIAHELIHTINNCDNHKNWFKYYANKISKYGYDVTRTTNDKDFKEFRNNIKQNKQSINKQHIYKVTCLACGRTVLRTRKINVNNYICPVCDGHLKLEEV